MLAYGQSGTGKTYTMGLNSEEGGTIQRSIDKVFEKLDRSDNFEVSVSFVEIYNEKVYDLLSENYQGPCLTKGALFNGSKKKLITSRQDANEILKIGNQNRHVRTTVHNETSSRSHAMFSIFLNPRSPNVEKSSVIHFCDLAGSEGLRTTNHKGIAQTESVHINQGLLAIRKVVQALSKGTESIPYRDSVLTTVLKDSLNVGSYIAIIGCISPNSEDCNETKRTVEFLKDTKTLNIPEFNAYQREKTVSRLVLTILIVHTSTRYFA